jgi:hypothetical protein
MTADSPSALWVLTPTTQQASGGWIDDTLAQRVRDAGMAGRLHLAGRFPRQRVEVFRGANAAAELNETFYRRGWTDGLPIVPPTLGRVHAMLAAAGREGTALLGEAEPLKGLVTAEKVAANAVMAGCRPEHFPLVLTAIEALLRPEFNLRGVQTTDENVTPLLIVNGPVAGRLEINASFGALGPGWQANATIGRAVRLAMHNLGGGWPGAVALAGLGQPGRYTLCLAEHEAASPWEPLHVELGFPAEQSALTVLRAESVINVTGGLEELASVMGSAASAFGMAYSGKVAVCLAPYTAQRLHAQGWSKADVRAYLHEHGRMSAELWERLWLTRQRKDAQAWPEWVRQAAATGHIPAVRDPDDIVLVVAGGTLAVPQQAYFPTWGFPPCRITLAIPEAVPAQGAAGPQLP